VRRHALREWALIERRVARHPRASLLVLADYDGTLTRIRRRPELARLDARTRAALRRLASRPGVRVGVVSGRALATVRRLARVPELIYVGNHGLEAAGLGVAFVHPAAVRARPHLARLARQLERRLRDVPGAWVENKRLSLSLHWRQVPARSTERFRRLAHDTLRPWVRQGVVRVSEGKRVIEARPPVAWNKGHAVAWLARRLRVAGARVIYVGDDRTDEDAFRAVNRLQGVSIHVGAASASSAARWRLDRPAQTRALLERLHR